MRWAIATTRPTALLIRAWQCLASAESDILGAQLCAPLLMSLGFSSSFSQRYTYFQSVAAAYLDALNILKSCWADRDTLHQGLQTLRDEAIATLAAVPRPQPPKSTPRQGIGLNTVGLLTDRLTILTIKEWNLRDRHHDPSAAQQLHDVQTHDILEALAAAVPAKGALNSKLTAHIPTLQADSWPAVIYDLFATNLLIWKAQDYLYEYSLKDAVENGVLERDRLEIEKKQGDRSTQSSQVSSYLLYTYTVWLPRMNVQRDGLIQRCEQLYWLTRHC